MIELTNATLTRGGFELTGLEMSLPTGTYAVLMGPTGAGKTSLLEALCGLAPLSSGRLVVAGREVTHAAPAARGIGYVPQDGALFDHLSVERNLSFALDVRGCKRRSVRERVAEIATSLGVTDLLRRRPRSLSGGERQRVALGRARAARPAVLLLDEPLSAVDEDGRAELARVLREATRACTVLHVTHSRWEAERLADTRLVLDAGGLRPVLDTGER